MELLHLMDTYVTVGKIEVCSVLSVSIHENHRFPLEFQKDHVMQQKNQKICFILAESREQGTLKILNNKKHFFYKTALNNSGYLKVNSDE